MASIVNGVKKVALVGSGNWYVFSILAQTTHVQHTLLVYVYRGINYSGSAKLHCLVLLIHMHDQN